MARMVDISEKEIVRRTAVAKGSLKLKSSTLRAISRNEIRKGDVISASKLAAIQAAKATSSILPLCHQIPLTSVEVDVSVSDSSLDAQCSVTADYKTGVEMEALVGVTVALLNAWDMVKYVEKDAKGQYPQTRITEVRVVSKKKGGR
jgi:cyclic pyranopterin phosphate synthase